MSCTRCHNYTNLVLQSTCQSSAVFRKLCSLVAHCYLSDMTAHHRISPYKNVYLLHMATFMYLHKNPCLKEVGSVKKNITCTEQSYQ